MADTHPQAEKATQTKRSGYSPARFPWLRPFVFIVLVLSLGLTAYFLLYANRRVEQRVQLAYDELSSVGEDIEARSAQLAKSLENRTIESLDGGRLRPEDLGFLQSLGLEARIEEWSQCGDRSTTVGRSRLIVRVAKKIDRARKCLTATISTRRMLRGLSDTSIDGVLIADDNGFVLGGDAKLPSMVSLDASLVSLAGGGARKPTSEGAAGSERPEGFDPLGLDDLPRTSVAGGEYLVLCVPLLGLVSDDGHETRLCGLVQEAELRRHALSLSPVASTWLLALVGALLLALPYLKIRFMSRRERLRASDMWLLAASAIALTSGGVLLVVFTYATHRFERTLDDNLTDFAATLREHFDAEISAAYHQLKAAAPELMNQPPETNPGAALEGEQSALLSSYPFFEAITLTDEARQVSKWMPRRLPSSLISLQDEPWLKRTLNLTRPRDFSLEQTFAPTTGLNLAIISVPVRFRFEGPNSSQNQIGVTVPLSQRTGAAAIAIEVVSMTYAVDPPPFGHALVTPEKKVAFRSDLSPRRLVPFSSEWERGAALLTRAGLHAPTEPADLRYRGRMYRVTAIRSAVVADVTLVGFYDKGIMESAISDSLHAPLLMVGLVAIGTLGAALLTGLAGSRALDWLWPTRDRSTLYLACSIGLVAAAGVWVFAAFHTPSWLLYALAGWPPLVIAALSMACAVDGSRQRLSSLAARVPRWTALFPTSYVIFGVAGLASIVAVPVAIVAWDSVLAHHEALQERMAVEGRDRFEEWKQRIETHWVEDADSGASLRTGQILIQGAPGVVAKAQAFGDHLPEQFPREQQEASNAAIPACRDILWPLPESRRFSLILSSCWEAIGGGVSGRMADLASIARPDWYSSITASRSAPIDWLRLWAGVTALLTAAWWFVRSVGQQILGLELEGDGVVDRSDTLHDKNGGPWLLLRPSRAQLVQIRSWLAIQPNQEISPAVPAVSPKDLDRDGPLLITGVERVLGDSTWSRELRNRLASSRPGPLVLVSEIDPLYFFQSRCREATGADAKRMSEEARAWALTMTSVERVRFALPPLGEPSEDRARQRIREECRWTDRLREIEEEVQERAHGRLDWDQTVELILDLAEPSYREQWNLCSTEERRVLRQLAEEGVVNPRCSDVLSRLRRRRLIRSNPRFQIVNDSFRSFILAAEDQATVRAWERPDGDRGSVHVRGPLLVFGMLALVLLLATEGKGTFAAITAAAGTIPLLRSLALAARGTDTIA